jgi:hypothetical protein
MNLQAVNNFLAGHDTCVIATVGRDSKPEAATVGFWHDNDFTILIGTNRTTRKYANLQHNRTVALVIGFDGKETVQIEGIAKEMGRADITEQLDKFMNKVPAVRKYADQSGQTYFLISPTWLRYTNYTADPPILETKDFS